jgi:hypothetical protein
VLGAFVLLYAGDWVVLNFRSPQTSQMQVKQVIAVRLKGTKVEYLPGDTISVTCTHSLFPQSGSEPCWYLSRHLTRQISYGDTTGSWRDF